MLSNEDYFNGDNGEEIPNIRVPNRLIAYRLRKLEKKVEEMEKKIDRLTFAIVTGLISLTVAITVFTLTGGSG